MAQATWQEKAAHKRSQAQQSIPSQWLLPASFLAPPEGSPPTVLDIPQRCGLLSPREIEITETVDATALLEKLASREYSAVEVTTAFCKRAAIAQQLTSCLTEMFFDTALRRAQELDEHLAATGKTVGPLHGLPISVKESYSIAGVPTTMGFVSCLDRPPQEKNSVVVDILLAAGAVFYVKTNIPQTMMTLDTHNNIFGRTLNPHNLNLTAGGSTGGEGALLALRGSLLGIGTDIAGSIRVPALCCGLTGFKPSVNRVPYGGQSSAARPGMTSNGILPSAGPLCHTVRDAALLLKVAINSRPADLDDNALDVPWRGVTPRSSTLRIGVLPEDPLYPLHPPMQRALQRAIDKLEAAGHTMVDISTQMPSISEAKDIAFRLFNMDPDRTPLTHVTRGDEPFIPSLRSTFDVDGSGPAPRLRELYELNVAKAGLLTRMRRVFVDNQLDVLVGPAYQSCAVPHDTIGVASYTVFCNLFNYPACVIPYSSAASAEDATFVRDVSYTPEYKPQEVEGAPCHIQLIGRPMRDEELIQCASAVEALLR
ncbi:putative general amidase [Aspergillus aculeatinus CBS 121060]|uniref:Amidase n=1 Tax=Aspergillus aculeatinus CBS 121060 TaxID=1448322 RepID=A0ACD1H0K3_9EURO|nr:amidase [Aspergillus aculeatinus CBS 121060]RAH67117.1 amidase [Aspergillus aculeatinus CBS 121060]